MFGRSKEIVSKAAGRFRIEGQTRQEAWNKLASRFGGNDHIGLYGYSHIALVNTDKPTQGAKIEVVGTRGGQYPGVITEWNEEQTTLAFALTDRTYNPDTAHQSYRFIFQKISGMYENEVRMDVEHMRKGNLVKPDDALESLVNDAGHTRGFADIGCYTVEIMPKQP
jgi:hypothetical protein